MQGASKGTEEEEEEVEEEKEEEEEEEEDKFVADMIRMITTTNQ